MIPLPLILPLGDRSVLVRFADTLDEDANLRAVGFARQLGSERPKGVVEIVPNLVSVLVRYDPRGTDFDTLSGELRLALSLPWEEEGAAHAETQVPVHYGGAEGPDLDAVAKASELDVKAFIARHAEASLKVLAIGFAPGFAYCGFHDTLPRLPRRGEVRPQVPAGTVLYAAGQTALTASPIPTGWHVIGRTDFVNFDPGATPPVRLRPGDRVRFVPQ